MEYGPAPISGVGKPTQRTAPPPRPVLRAVVDDTPPPAVQQEFDVAARVIEQFGWEGADMGTAVAARAIEPLCQLWCIPGFRDNDWAHAFHLLRP